LARGFVSGLPTVCLDPDLVFLVFLPSILWAAAYFTSWRDFRANARPIILLAVGHDSGGGRRRSRRAAGSWMGWKYRKNKRPFLLIRKVLLGE
jgi:hypothetical protein